MDLLLYGLCLLFGMAIGSAVLYFALVTPARASAASSELQRSALEARLEAERANREMLVQEAAAARARAEELTKVGGELEQKFSSLASQALGRNSESFLQLVSERFAKHSETAQNDLASNRP